MNLMKSVQEYIKTQKIGSPIFITDIMQYLVNTNGIKMDSTQTRQNVTVILTRIVKEHENFKRHSPGVYYFCKNPPTEGFDETGMNVAELIDRMYINDHSGNRFGYITGDAFAEKIGIQISRNSELQIATNEKRNKKICTKELDVHLVNPPTEVTKDNFRYLQVLDLLKMDAALITSPKKLEALFAYMCKYQLSNSKLIAFAAAYYNQKVVLRAAELTRMTVFNAQNLPSDISAVNESIKVGSTEN